MADNNPFNALPEAKKNPFDAIAEVGKNAFDTPVGKTAVGLGGKVLDLLARPGNATEAALARGPQAGWQTLVHSESDGQHERDRDQIKRVAHIKELIDKIPGGLPRGIADTAIDLALDPTTYAGGLGLIEKAANTAGRGAYIGLARGTEAAANSTNDLLHGAGRAAQTAHDFVTPGGRRMATLKRTLAAKNGREGLDTYAQVRSIQKGTLGNVAGGVENALAPGLKKAVSGLSHEEEMAVYRAVDEGKIDTLPAKLQARAHAVDQTFKSIAHLQGTRPLQEQLAQGGFALPAAAQKFASAKPRGVQDASRFRQAYMPHPYRDIDALAPEPKANEVDPLFGEDVHGAPASRQELTKRNPFLKPRSENSLLGKTVREQRDVNQRALSEGAKQIARADTKRALMDAFGEVTNPAVKGSQKHLPPAMKKAFYEDAPQAPTALGQAAKLLRKGTRGTTAAMFFNPSPHMGNVVETGLLSDPLSTLLGLGRYAGSAEFVPHTATREALQRLPGIKGLAESGQRARDAAAQAGAIDVNPERDIPGLINNIPVLKQGYGASNHLLWGTDDAIKAAQYAKRVKQFTKAGDAPKVAQAKAAQRVGEDMIDYGDLSDLTRALKTVLPFATYATKKPGVIARAVARHPERVLSLTRNNPNFVPGAKPDGLDRGRPLTSVYRGANDPMQYVRGSVGAPTSDILSALGAHDFTYGDPGKKPHGWEKLLLTQTLGNLPYGDDLLTALGLNYFHRR